MTDEEVAARAPREGAASSAAEHDEREAGGIWSGRYLPVTIANLTLVAMVAFEGLAVVAALPSIAEDLGRVALAPWIISAFLATAAVAGIVAGPVIDAIGVRRTFRFTGIWFLLTSAAAALAPSMEILIAARIAQGLGGGLVISVALAAIGLTYPHRLRPRVFAANSVVWGVMGFGGPALAALLLAIGNWRWVFGVQFPVTALALAAGWNTLPSTRDRPARIHTDWSGIAMLAGFTAATLLGVTELADNWIAGVAGMAVAVVLAALYWRHAGRSDEPVLERTHLVRFPLRRIHLTSGLVLMAGLTDAYLPLYMQTTRDQSVTIAAFSVLFVTVGWTLSALIVARLLERWREVDAILLGGLLIVPSVAAAGIAIAMSAPLALVYAAFFLIGMAIGFVSTAGLTLLQSNSSPDEMGRTNAAHQYVRTMGITFSVAVSGAILLAVVDSQIGDVEVVRQVLAGDDIAVGSATTQAVADGMVAVMVFAEVIAVLCLVSAWQLRQRVSALARSPAPVAPPG